MPCLACLAFIMVMSAFLFFVVVMLSAFLLAMFPLTPFLVFLDLVLLILPKPGSLFIRCHDEILRT